MLPGEACYSEGQPIESILIRFLMPINKIFNNMITFINIDLVFELLP